MEALIDGAVRAGCMVDILELEHDVQRFAEICRLEMLSGCPVTLLEPVTVDAVRVFSIVVDEEMPVMDEALFVIFLDVALVLDSAGYVYRIVHNLQLSFVAVVKGFTPYSYMGCDCIVDVQAPVLIELFLSLHSGCRMQELGLLSCEVGRASVSNIINKECFELLIGWVKQAINEENSKKIADYAEFKKTMEIRRREQAINIGIDHGHIDGDGRKGVEKNQTVSRVEIPTPFEENKKRILESGDMLSKFVKEEVRARVERMKKKSGEDVVFISDRQASSLIKKPTRVGDEDKESNSSGEVASGKGREMVLGNDITSVLFQHSADAISS